MQNPDKGDFIRRLARPPLKQTFKSPALMSRFGDKKETKAETDVNCLYRQLGHPIGTTRMIENGKWGRCDFIIFIISIVIGERTLKRESARDGTQGRDNSHQSDDNGVRAPPDKNVFYFILVCIFYKLIKVSFID